MKKEILIILLLMVTSVNAGYIDLREPCKDKIDYETFMYDCPSNHRITGDWLNIKYYFETESISYCVNGELLQECSYEIRPWVHPNVVGGQFYHEPVIEIHEPKLVCKPGTGCMGDWMCEIPGYAGFLCMWV